MKLFFVPLIYLAIFCLLLSSAYASSSSSQNEKKGNNGEEEEEDKYNDYEVYEAIENMRKLTKHDNFYDLIGITSNASEEEIGRAFRKMSVKYHPDKHGKDKEPMFKLVQYVGLLLRDPKRRARYEWLLHDAPAWHRESVYAVRRVSKMAKLSMRQFWIVFFAFSIGGQILAQWLSYFVRLGRVKYARREVNAMGDKEVKKIRRKLESGDAAFLAQNNSDYEMVLLSDSPNPACPSIFDVYILAIPIAIIRRLFKKAKAPTVKTD